MDSKSEAKPMVVFLFPGHGYDFENMTAGFYKTVEKFRNSIDECIKLCKNCEKIVELYKKNQWASNFFANMENFSDLISKKSLENPILLQVTVFIIQYAISQTLIDFGIKPSVVMGQSFGEYCRFREMK